MRGIWKDGFKKFSRDANVHWRGIEGRTSFNTKWDGWNTCGSGSKKAYGRIHSKEVRRTFKKELPELLEEAYWEIDQLLWEDSWFEPEDLLAEIGLQEAEPSHYDYLYDDYLDWQDIYGDFPVDSCMNF